METLPLSYEEPDGNFYCKRHPYEALCAGLWDPRTQHIVKLQYKPDDDLAWRCKECRSIPTNKGPQMRYGPNGAPLGSTDPYGTIRDASGRATGFKSAGSGGVANYTGLDGKRRGTTYKDPNGGSTSTDARGNTKSHTDTRGNRTNPRGDNKGYTR